MQLHLRLSPSTLPRPLTPHPKPTLSMRRNRHLSVSAKAVSPAAAVTANMYELLSVPETAGPEEIKAAYRKQARLWHPDTCPSSSDKRFFAEQFIRAREAYEVLSDPVLREDYDLALRAGVSPGSWAAALSAGVGFRKAGDRAGPGCGFGDWEAQLDGLKRRRGCRSGDGSDTWGSRMRRADRSGPSDG